MSGLDIGQAPAPRDPWRFLRTSLVWGIAAGALWLWQGSWALTSRWAPVTVVSVHIWALGVLGNAMLGSLLQFLPVAAHSPLALPVPARWVHHGFNLGLVLLLAFFLAPWPMLAAAAVLLLASSLGILAWRALMALRQVANASALHRGLESALWYLLITVSLGAAAATVLAGQLNLPIENVVNLHAAVGLGGWCVGLLIAVGAVTVPMFQGARVLSSITQNRWRRLLAALLGMAMIAAISTRPDATLLLGVALPCAALGATILWMQWRTAHPRNPSLRMAWRAGALFLQLPLLFSVLLSWLPDETQSPSMTVLAGTSILAAGLPLLVIGMQWEIVPFLAWIELRQRLPRGLRVPGVGRLLAAEHKQQLVLLHGVAAVAALTAALAPAATRLAGALVLLAYASSLLRLSAVWRSARAYTPAPTPASRH